MLLKVEKSIFESEGTVAQPLVSAGAGRACST